MTNEILIKEGFHRNKKQLFLSFEYDSKLIYLLKNIGNASWSQTHNSWYIANSEKILKAVKQELEPLGIRLIESNEYIGPNPANGSTACPSDRRKKS